jgi:23S rRNA pseudouridine1911/1915/1917 synthase
VYGAPARLVIGPSRQRTDPELESLELRRNFLHAAELEFSHPKTGKAMHLESKLPAELEGLLGKIEAGR